MELLFDPQEPLKIGATGMDAITQNIRMIILTMRCSVPLNRAFAHDGRMIDSPAPVDTARLMAELVAAIEKYEPRVKMEKIELVHHEGGLEVVAPKVHFSLKKGAVL